MFEYHAMLPQVDQKDREVKDQSLERGNSDAFKKNKTDLSNNEISSSKL